MQLIIHQRDDISYVALEGRLDADGVDVMEEPFTAATVARGLPVVVDMSGVTFMSSLGIGFLFANTKKLKKAGCKLVLLNPLGMVETVLKTSKMDKVMPLVYDLREAVTIVGGDPTIGAPDTTARGSAAAEQAAPGTPVATGDNVIKMRIKNEMAELTNLYAAANELLTRFRLPYRSGYAVNLAIEELVVNVIRYAYLDDDEHPIDIGMGVFNEQVVLEIRDYGRPFDPREAPDHDPEAEDLEVGGLGLILVLDLVDSLSYRREEDANHVQACIHIRPEEDGRLWSVQDQATAAATSEQEVAPEA